MNRAEKEGGSDTGGTSIPDPVWVPLKGGDRRGYSVVVTPGALKHLPELAREAVGAERYAVISDSTVAPLYGEKAAALLTASGAQADLFTFPAGEKQKSREWWGRLTDALLAEGLGRDAAVVAVGGGVTGDLAGFVAATCLRGLPVIQVPTSLVAMIDSAVGGKTGVDHPQGKNLVGAFHPPSLVVADPEVIRTLPRLQRSQGLAEALKHGAIRDVGYARGLGEEAEALLGGEGSSLARAVQRSVEIKAEVVGQDEREAGLRQILNFGHTIGHGLEAATDYALPHGSAVSIGMVLESRLGERLGVTEEGTAEVLEALLKELELPTDPPVALSPRRVAQFMKADKKVRAGRVGVVLLRRMGEVDPGTGWVHRVADEELTGFLTSVL